MLGTQPKTLKAVSNPLADSQTVTITIADENGNGVPDYLPVIAVVAIAGGIALAWYFGSK